MKKKKAKKSKHTYRIAELDLPIVYRGVPVAVVAEWPWDDVADEFRQDTHRRRRFRPYLLFVC